MTLRGRLGRGLCLVAALWAGACDDDPFGPRPRTPLEQLPSDLAELTFSASGRPSTPYVLLEPQHPSGFRGFVAVDGEGRPVWYFRTVGSPLGSTRRANGNFVLLDTDRGLIEVTVDGEVVRELAQEARPGRFIHHDVTATPHNTLLFIAEDVRPVADSSVTGDAIWEWLPESGATTRRWSSFDHLDPEVDRGPRSRASDWVHANSVSVGASGATLVSLHFLDQVVALTPDWSGIVWRLGGVRATVPVDDPFSGQHTAVELEPGRVLLFDNGYDREQERYSRAAEYVFEGSSARLDWEWRPEPDNWARVISSARRLPNGNTLVAFGLTANEDLGTDGPIEVYEVTRSGRVVWHLVVGGTVSAMYRATPLGAF